MKEERRREGCQALFHANPLARANRLHPSSGALKEHRGSRFLQRVLEPQVALDGLRLVTLKAQCTCASQPARGPNHPVQCDLERWIDCAGFLWASRAARVTRALRKKENSRIIAKELEHPQGSPHHLSLLRAWVPQRDEQRPHRLVSRMEVDCHLLPGSPPLFTGSRLKVHPRTKQDRDLSSAPLFSPCMRCLVQRDKGQWRMV